MADMLREAPLGQLIRLVTRNRILRYPEEMPGFELPASYNLALNSPVRDSKGHADKALADEVKTPLEDTTPSAGGLDLEKEPTRPDKDIETLTLSRTKSRLETTPYTEERLEIEEELALERTRTTPIAPRKTADGSILVEWYTTDDPANPQNWSRGKRFAVSLIICIYTFVVYAASAIYTSSEAGVMEKFNVGPVAASLPLSLYVLAYGVGPLVWAPLSEIAAVGRSPVYATTMALFLIISIPTALVDNFAGLLVLRFLQGFLGSPCLANGGATMGDMYSLLYLPFALVSWVSAAYCGPALGPLLSGFAVTAEGWRWSLWEILWAAAPALTLMLAILPETSTPNILRRRARRLRKLTGDQRLKAQSEIDERSLNASAVFLDAIIKPLEITIKDPAIAFVNLYTALIYAIYYSFFEVFPLVYPVYYGFTLGTMGVVFTCILIACLIGVGIYCTYLQYILIPDIKANGLRAQESRLVPALFACFFPTIGLFIFAWTAKADITWVAPTIGIVVYGASCFIVLQCIFVYVPLSYPQYAASLFAGNDFFRSALACGSILFGRPLYVNLGVGRGVSLLGGLSVIGIVGIFGLWVFGAKLRARSRFAI